MYGSVALLLAALGLALAAPQSSSISAGASSLLGGTQGAASSASAGINSGVSLGNGVIDSIKAVKLGAAGMGGSMFQAGTNMAKTGVSTAAGLMAPIPGIGGVASLKAAGINGVLDMANSAVQAGVRGYQALEGAKLGMAQQGLSLMGGAANAGLNAAGSASSLGTSLGTTAMAANPLATAAATLPGMGSLSGAMSAFSPSGATSSLASAGSAATLGTSLATTAMAANPAATAAATLPGMGSLTGMMSSFSPSGFASSLASAGSGISAAMNARG